MLPDLAAAALAEASVRDSPTGDRLLCVGLGSGANAALAVDRQVVDLADGALGDAGHVIVEPDGPTCPCGGRGCLEAVCSGIALARDGAPFGTRRRTCRHTSSTLRAIREAIGLLDRAGVALGRADRELGRDDGARRRWSCRRTVLGGRSLARAGPSRARSGGSTPLVSRHGMSDRRPGADATLIGAAIAAGNVARSLMQAPSQEKGSR